MTQGTIIVTGGAGFIGSNIVADLCDDYDVVVCDWLGSDDKWRNLAKRDLADIVFPEQLNDFLAAREDDIIAVVHMGAISSTTERDADLILKSNFQLSKHLWEWSGRFSKRLIYASSAATYGNGTQGFVDDESRDGLSVLKPLNAYGWSKHLFDRYVARQLAHGALAPIQWAGLKFFNVYGPNEYHKGSMKSVIAQIYPDVAAGKSVKLFRSHNPQYADGGQLRDFVYIKDCVDVVRWLLNKEDCSGLFNLGTGNARSFKDLATAVFGAAGQEPKIEYIDTPIEIRDKYQYFTQAEMSKLRGAGYNAPFTELEAGVDEYVKGFLSSEDGYK